MAGQGATAPSLAISTAVTPDDHGAQIVVVGILCLIASTLSFLTRLCIRWPWSARLGLDDVVCMAATLVSAAQSATVFGGVSRGFGQKPQLLRQSQVEVVEKILYATNLLFVTALFLGKLAITTLFCRLSMGRGSKYLTAGLFAYGIAAFCIVALGRPIHEPWHVGDAASSNTLARWATVEAVGMVIDCVLIAYPFMLIRNLKMDRGTKVAVIIGFALRFPVVILSALRLASLATMDYTGFTFSYVEPEILAQAEMHYNTIAATIPCLRLFLKGWRTGFLGTALEEMDPAEYTRHSSVAKSPRTPHTSSNKSHRLSWRRRQRDMSEIFDGDHRGPQTSVSSQQEIGNRSVSRGSERSITVEHRISVDI